GLAGLLCFKEASFEIFKKRLIQILIFNFLVFNENENDSICKKVSSTYLTFSLAKIISKSVFDEQYWSFHLLVSEFWTLDQFYMSSFIPFIPFRSADYPDELRFIYKLLTFFD